MQATSRRATPLRRQGFSVDGWLKTSVPSTVLAAQVAGRYRSRSLLRRQPSPDSRHQLSHRAQLLQSADAGRQPVSLRLVVPQGIQASRLFRERRSPLAAFRRNQLSRRGLAQWAQDRRFIHHSRRLSHLRFRCNRVCSTPAPQMCSPSRLPRRPRKTWASTGSTGIPARLTRTWACGERSILSKPAPVTAAITHGRHALSRRHPQHGRSHGLCRAAQRHQTIR